MESAVNNPRQSLFILIQWNLTDEWGLANINLHCLKFSSLQQTGWSKSSQHTQWQTSGKYTVSLCYLKHCKQILHLVSYTRGNKSLYIARRQWILSKGDIWWIFLQVHAKPYSMNHQQKYISQRLDFWKRCRYSTDSKIETILPLSIVTHILHIYTLTKFCISSVSLSLKQIFNLTISNNFFFQITNSTSISTLFKVCNIWPYTNLFELSKFYHG